MTYFSQMVIEGFEVPILSLVVDEKELYLKLNAYDLPERGCGLLQDEWHVFCVNWHDKESCSIETTKVTILFFYNSHEFDVPLSSCHRMEYTSATLVKLMCSYKTKICDSDMSAFIDDEFQVGDIIVRFIGNKVFNEQQIKYNDTFDPAIIIEKSEPFEPDQIWRYIQAIDDILRLVFFEKRIAIPDIRLVDDSNQYLPFYVVKNDDAYVQYYESGFENVYNKIKSQIITIFSYVLNHRVECSFFEKYYMSDNIQSLFFNTYSNFDKLAQKKYSKAEKNEELEKFKAKIWNIIEKDEDYSVNKENLGGLKDKIMSHGTQVGQKKKLQNAFDDILGIIPRRAKYYQMDDDKIIDRICELRTDIVHKGKVIEFTERDSFCLEKFQWITYIILLRKIGIEENVIEEWMDRVMGVG